MSAFLANTPSMSSFNVETNPPISAPDSSPLVRANEGRTLHAFGEVFVVLLDGKQTGEKFTAFSVSVHLAGGRGRTITNAKTNGSISSRAYALSFPCRS